MKIHMPATGGIDEPDPEADGGADDDGTVGERGTDVYGIDEGLPEDAAAG